MRPAEGTLAGRGDHRGRQAFGAVRDRFTGLLSLLVGVALACTIPLVEAVPASATPIPVLHAQAHNLAMQIETTQTKIAILSEEYDEASGHAAALRAEIEHDSLALNTARTSVNHDSTALQHEAVNAYVEAGSSESLPAVLSTNAGALPLRQTYLSFAAGSVDTAISTLQNSEIALNERRSVLAQAEEEASATTRTLGSAQSEAESLEGSLSQTLAGVQGSLATAVEAQEQAAQQQAAAAAAARQTAAAAQAASTPSWTAPATTPAAPTLDDSGTSDGAAAVSTAQTQLGVPYVWAGATPGVGFDCSGLTMWAWGQAGVSLPHSAAEQYTLIEHISFSDLEPGDLIFYAAGGYIYHVVMYIGGGDVIQAEETGTPVQITSVPPGAYAAGRP